jgi:phosphoglycolate phosphatase
MASPIVVFDLDGTLVDTAPDLVASLNAILAREGLPPLDYHAARNLVGGGARMMLERGLSAAGRTLPAAAAIDRLTRDFIDHYAEHLADSSEPFPGIELALDTLLERGYRLAVCTNKFERLSVRLLDVLGLSKRFSAICGADTFGDSLTDIATARAADIPVIAVDFGYSDTPVAVLAPDRIISRFTDLPEAVFAVIGGPSGEFTVNSEAGNLPYRRPT